MYIALIADTDKKELMAQFCIAYSGILANHHLCATQTTGKYISNATNLEIETFLAGEFGGVEQIASRVSFNEIDVVFYFRTSGLETESYEAERNLLRLCDVHNIPVATNIATAEAIVTSIDHGELSWREFVNPRSEYNMKKKKNKETF